MGRTEACHKSKKEAKDGGQLDSSSTKEPSGEEMEGGEPFAPSAAKYKARAGPAICMSTSGRLCLLAVYNVRTRSALTSRFDDLIV